MKILNEIKVAPNAPVIVSRRLDPATGGYEYDLTITKSRNIYSTFDNDFRPDILEIEILIPDLDIPRGSMEYNEFAQITQSHIEELSEVFDDVASLMTIGNGSSKVYSVRDEGYDIIVVTILKQHIDKFIIH